jgi:hypothetical protein
MPNTTSEKAPSTHFGTERGEGSLLLAPGFSDGSPLLLVLQDRIRMQPQRDVGWLHRLPYHPYQVVSVLPIPPYSRYHGCERKAEEEGAKEHRSSVGKPLDLLALLTLGAL